MTRSDTDRHLRALEGMFYRLDTGRSGLRNHEATSRALAAHWRDLRAALEAGGFEELDNNPALARRYSKIERRYLIGRYDELGREAERR